MKRQANLAFTSLLLLCGVALAQPDLTNAPKGENPPNRNAAAKAAARAGKKALPGADLKERNAKRIELRLQRVPKMLTTLGVTEAATQDAVAAHFQAVLKAREPLQEAQLKLRRVLVSKIASDAQIKAALDAQRAARKDYETAFQKALDDLDKKVSYTKNTRLEAALLAIGALDPDGVTAAL